MKLPKAAHLFTWLREHPVKASALSGWLQQACGTGGAILTIPIILHKLGDATAGLWFSLLGFITLFSLADFGFSPAISRQVAHSFKLDPNQESHASDLFATSPGWPGVSALYAASRVIFTRVTLGGVVLLVIAHELVLPWTSLLPSRNTESTWVWYLLGGTMLLSFQTRLSQAFLDGLGFMYVGRLISGVYQLAWNLLSIVVLWVWPGLIGMAVVLLVTSLVQYWAMHAALAHFTEGQLSFREKAPQGMAGRLWRPALPYGLVSSGGYLESAAQVPLLGSILGPSAVAPFYIALKIIGTMGAAVSQAMTSQWPFFTHECAQGHWKGARLRMRKTILIGFAFHLLAALFLYFASPWIVNLWVGPGHYLDRKTLLWVSASYLLGNLAALPVYFVLASGRNPFAITTLLHGVLTVAGVALLCPRFGIAGVPIASITAGLLTNFWFAPLQGWKVWCKLKSRDKDFASS